MSTRTYVLDPNFPLNGQNFKPQEEIPTTERNSLLQEEISCHRKKYPNRGVNFL